MIVDLKENGHGVEIKKGITGDDLKLVTTMFVNDGFFLNLGEITDIQWYEALQKHQITPY